MVIESQGQLDKVIELVKTKNFFIQVLCDTIKKHPSDDKISVIMLYFDEWYVVPFDHIDCINLSDAQQEQFLVELVCSNTKKYCVVRFARPNWSSFGKSVRQRNFFLQTKRNHKS